MNLLVLFSPPSRCCVSVRYKYSPEHFVLEHSISCIIVHSHDSISLRLLSCGIRKSMQKLGTALEMKDSSGSSGCYSGF